MMASAALASALHSPRTTTTGPHHLLFDLTFRQVTAALLAVEPLRRLLGDTRALPVVGVIAGALMTTPALGHPGHPVLRVVDPVKVRC